MKLATMDNIVAGRDDRATFERAKRLGFAGVEVNLARGHLRDTDALRLKHLADAKASTGLAIPSLVLGEHNNGGIGSADINTAEAAREDIRQAIGWAAELGAQVILVPFFFAGDVITSDAIGRAVQSFRELCPLAKERGITLCYEGTLPTDAIQLMAEQIGSPAFGCYFDLANVVWRGMDTATEIRGLGGLIRQVHMKESRVGPGDCQPGLGRVDYQSSVDALREIGYNGWLVMETPAGPDAMVLRDVSFTRRLFPQIEWSTPWPRFGAFSYGFKRGEVAQMIAQFQRLGLTTVQLADALLEDALEQPDQIKEQLDTAGISITALAGYRNLITPDLAKRRANLDFVTRCLQAAPLLGCEVVATETGTFNRESEWAPSPDNWGDEAWKAFHAALDELLPVAEQHGSILALEGYVNNVLITHGQLLGLLERYPTKHLQVVLDPYNYLSRHLLPAAERVTAAFFKRFEHRFVLAHLKDVGAEGAEKDTPEFGTGVFPQQMYLEFLRDQRPDLALILEHLPYEHIPSAIQRVYDLLENAQGRSEA
jgi:sugar phosphate isomerase/epimerase